MAGDAAVLHGSELAVLTAWLPIPPPLAGTTSTLPTHGVTNPGETAKEQLMEAIRDVPGEDPPVLVRPQVKEGNATKLPIDLSQDTDLLVVGSSGHGAAAPRPLVCFLPYSERSAYLTRSRPLSRSFGRSPLHRRSTHRCQVRHGPRRDRRRLAR